MAIIFALVSYLGWSIGDIFGTISARKLNAYSVALWFQIFSLLIMFPLVIFFADQLKFITLPLLVLTLSLGVLSTVALACFYEAFKRSNATLVGTLVSSFAAISVILSIVFLQERVTFFQFSAICLIFFGIVLSTLNFKEIITGKIIKDTGILFAIGAMLLWGVYFAFIKIPVDSIGWFWPAYLSALTFPVILVPIFIGKIKIQKPTANKAFFPMILNAFLLSMAALSYNLAIERGLTSVVAPIAGSYPTLFAVLSYFVFKDPLEIREIFGITITLVGIVLLSASNF